MGVTCIWVYVLDGVGFGCVALRVLVVGFDVGGGGSLGFGLILWFCWCDLGFR